MAELGAAAGRSMVWGVAGLLHALGDTLAARFASCTVEGELSGFQRAASGHCYFSLKDAEGLPAALRCALFRRAASMLDFVPRDGQRVQVRGRVALYEPRGELQFVVESMQAAGAGALYERFLRLKARLEAEGLFDTQRKRALPPYPRTIGIVTSLAAAALRDVLSTLARRAPQVRVIIYPSPVQGAEAPAALCEALALANGRAEADVLLLCRGGGSLEDLWAFNDERLVRAVAASVLPLVCGVGHETDVTLADLAADLRAATPTAAAERVAPAATDEIARLDALAHRLRRLTRHQLDVRAQRLDAIALRSARPMDALARQHDVLALLAHRLQASLREAIADRRRALVTMAETLRRGTARRPGDEARLLVGVAARLRRAGDQQLRAEQRRLAADRARLAALDPRRVLARGYAWVTDDQGHALASVHALSPGQTMRAVLADGSAEARVVSIEPEAGNGR